MREIARQVVEQTGSQEFQSFDEMENEDNIFLDTRGSGADADAVIFNGSLPPPSHLPSLISALPGLSRPVVVLLDSFHLFTDHPRQGLLYCLFDTVQSCRNGTGSQHGLAVVGMTSRVDVLTGLEKRVKSRFSHRTIRTAGMASVEEWLSLLKICFSVTCKNDQCGSFVEWQYFWKNTVDAFLQDKSLKEVLNHVFGISKDLRILLRVMVSMVFSSPIKALICVT